MVLLAFSYLAGEYLGNLIFGVIMFIVGFFSLASFYFPTKYRLDEEGVERVFMGMRAKRAWKELRRIEYSKGSLRLSPFTRRSILDPFRGIELPLCGNKGLVESFVKQRIASRND